MASDTLVDQGPIVPTESAIKKIAALLRGEDTTDMVLVIGARPGGCSGLSWEMYFAPRDAAEIGEGSEVCTYTAGDDTATVVVDPTTAQLSRGSTLDFKDGLDQSGFSITNPNAQRTCGCGQSFS